MAEGGEAWARHPFPGPAFRAKAVVMLVLAVTPTGQQARAEEIAWFKLTGLSGHLLVDFLGDGLDTAQSGVLLPGGATRQDQRNLREELFLMTRSYVYHPNLLSLDVGGGPILQNTVVDQDGNRTSAGKGLFNFTGRASILKEKSLRGNVFFDHLNPTVTVAPGEVMVQESERYGFDAAYSGKGITLPVRLGFTRTHTQGSGADRVQDDDMRQFRLDLSRNYGVLGSSTLYYQLADQASSSGSLNLPIQATTSRSQGISLDTRLQFGKEVPYDLSHALFLNRRSFTLAQGELPSQGDAGTYLDFHVRPSKRLNGFANVRYSTNDQGATTLVNQALSSGFTFLPTADLETALSVRAEGNDADQYAVNSRVLDGTVRYKTPLPLGQLQTSYGARYEMRDQQAANPLVTVLDEHVVLSGTGQVALSRSHVVGGSVVVTNLAQSQTYVENVDYLVVLVGTETRLQRLVGGAILDGEEVLVDYTYDLGGTYGSTQMDQTLAFNWNMGPHLESYLRWSDSTPAITSGLSTFPLNPSRTFLAGMRGEVQAGFGLPFTFGGSYEQETRSEVISPYRRQAADLFVQSTEPWLGVINGRLTVRRTRVTYDFSSEDVDLTGAEFRVWGRRMGLDLSAVAGWEQDVGGTLPRSRRDFSLNGQWRERKLTVTTSLVRSRESQGGYERDHTSFRLVLRRDF